MQTYRHGSEPFSLQRRNLKGGTKALEGWGFRNETDALTDVLLGSPAHLRHLSTSSLSRKHLREAPCNVQVGQAQHAELVSAYEHFGVKVHMHKPEPDLPKVKAVAKPKEKPVEKQKVIAARRVKLAEENCLARAIYFEARSETELGQLAVAKVILNRKNDPDFPKTICGVVYQGSGRRNSCQFSFACDGLPDDVKQPAAWANAKRIAQKSIAGDQSVQAIGTATNYHADYVKPKWAKSMRRLIKIGRHIFYADT